MRRRGARAISPGRFRFRKGGRRPSCGRQIWLTTAVPDKNNRASGDKKGRWPVARPADAPAARPPSWRDLHARQAFSATRSQHDGHADAGARRRRLPVARPPARVPRRRDRQDALEERFVQARLQDGAAASPIIYKGVTRAAADQFALALFKERRGRLEKGPARGFTKTTIARLLDAAGHHDGQDSRDASAFCVYKLTEHRRGCGRQVRRLSNAPRPILPTAWST